MSEFDKDQKDIYYDSRSLTSLDLTSEDAKKSNLKNIFGLNNVSVSDEDMDSIVGFNVLEPKS